jgi:hypothetical protein
MDKVTVVALSSSILEACCFQISDRFTDLSWHNNFLSKIRISFILFSTRSRFQPSGRRGRHSRGTFSRDTAVVDVPDNDAVADAVGVGD